MAAADDDAGAGALEGAEGGSGTNFDGTIALGTGAEMTASPPCFSLFSPTCFSISLRMFSEMEFSPRSRCVIDWLLLMASAMASAPLRVKASQRLLGAKRAYASVMLLAWRSSDMMDLLLSSMQATAGCEM